MSINLKIICKFLILFFCLTFIILKILFPIFIADEVIVIYGLRKFDICIEYPKVWNYIKITYIVTLIFSNLILSSFLSNLFSRKYVKDKKSNKKNQKPNKITKDKSLKLIIGYDENTDENIYVPEAGMYQNFLITGTIGTGKTSSAMYPFTEQLLKYNSLNRDKKIGMLILDVKGNYYKQVKEYAKKYNLLNDLIVIELGSELTYNPLYKPNLKASVLANRLKTILNLFSESNSESYWMDKAEQVLTEAIKLCRLYNNNYVDFIEIHKIITEPNYYKNKINILREKFIKSKFSVK